MTVHVTIALDEDVKAKLDALADARQAPIDDIVAMAVLDMAVEEEAAPFVSADEEAAFAAAVDEGTTCRPSTPTRTSRTRMRPNTRVDGRRAFHAPWRL